MFGSKKNMFVLDPKTGGQSILVDHHDPDRDCHFVVYGMPMYTPYVRPYPTSVNVTDETTMDIDDDDRADRGNTLSI
jgi:predicted nucleotidyltransferase